MKNNTAQIVSVILVGVLTAAVIGFALRRSAVPRGSAVKVIAGVDDSTSVRQSLPGGGTLLGRSIVTLAKLGTRLDSERDHLVLFQVNREVHEFFDDLAPRGREKFQWMLVRQTRRATPKGTFPAKFWTEAARRAEDTSVPVAIVYAGDADNDDLTTQSVQKMSTAARRLAANNRVCDVTIFGASPKNWSKLRDIFKPLGDRLHLHAPDEMNPAPLLERLDRARLSASKTNIRSSG